MGGTVPQSGRVSSFFDLSALEQLRAEPTTCRDLDPCNERRLRIEPRQLRKHTVDDAVFALIERLGD